MTEDTFSIQFCGNCLGNLIPAGTMMTADKEAPIAPWDVVSVRFKAIEGPFVAMVNSLGSEGFAGVCKLYLGRHLDSFGETIIRLGQINPPLVLPVPASVIDEIVQISIPGHNIEARATSEDTAALRLLEPFASPREEVQ